MLPHLREHLRAHADDRITPQFLVVRTIPSSPAEALFLRGSRRIIPVLNPRNEAS